MVGFRAFKTANRREFRIKHPCRCYYVVWKGTGGKRTPVSWYFCPVHAAEFKAFEEQTADVSN
jgi:hypothetical protein